MLSFVSQNLNRLCVDVSALKNFEPCLFVDYAKNGFKFRGTIIVTHYHSRAMIAQLIKDATCAGIILRRMPFMVREQIEPATDILEPTQSSEKFHCKTEIARKVRVRCVSVVTIGDIVCSLGCQICLISRRN